MIGGAIKSFPKNLVDCGDLGSMILLSKKVSWKISKFIGLSKTWLCYSSSHFNPTIIKRLLSTGLGCDTQFISALDIGILHILPFNVQDWIFGIIVTFLKKILLDASALSSLQIVWSWLGSLSTTSLLASAWHCFAFLFNFLSNVRQI